MKAPDKLYLSWVIWESFINTVRDPDNDTQVEYIRKNALLEWLKDAIDYSSKERQGAYQNVIDKINSL